MQTTRLKLSLSSQIQTRFNSKAFTISQLCFICFWLLSRYLDFCGKSFNEGIDRVQRISLRVVYNDYTSNYNDLLKKGNHLRIHDINKRKLLIEVYKCLNNTNPSFLTSLFKTKPIRFNLRTVNLLQLPNSNTHTYGLKSITYRGSMHSF